MRVLVTGAFGYIGMAVARQRVVAVEFAEAAAEGDVLLARDLLLAKQQDAALEEGPVDPVEFGVAERLAEIDAGRRSRCLRWSLL